MNGNGLHYERAFEAFLKGRRLPFVAVDQARKAIFAGRRLKSFDFLIHPPNHLKVLSDVKGRKLSYGQFVRGRAGESWTTAEDVEDLKNWQHILLMTKG